MTESDRSILAVAVQKPTSVLVVEPHSLSAFPGTIKIEEFEQFGQFRIEGVKGFHVIIL